MLTPRRANRRLSERSACLLGLTAERGIQMGRGGTLKQLTDPAARKQVVDNIKLLLYSTDRSVSDSC